MSDLSTKTRGEVVVDLMFLALAANDAVLNAHAAHVMALLSGEPVSRMVREASRPTNGRTYRLRLLGVIERVGSVPTVADGMDLGVLASNTNPKIREAAVRCLTRCPVAES